MADERLLLSVVEMGAYPNFANLYREKGYRTEVINSGRKAITYLKRNTPDVIVTEFNYQHAFRDRTSSLESILAVVQGRPEMRIIVFYEPEQIEQLEQLQKRFSGFTPIPLPVTEADITHLL